MHDCFKVRGSSPPDVHAQKPAR